MGSGNALIVKRLLVRTALSLCPERAAGVGWRNTGASSTLTPAEQEGAREPGVCFCLGVREEGARSLGIVCPCGSPGLAVTRGGADCAPRPGEMKNDASQARTPLCPLRVTGTRQPGRRCCLQPGRVKVAPVFPHGCRAHSALGTGSGPRDDISCSPTAW